MKRRSRIDEQLAAIAATPAPRSGRGSITGHFTRVHPQAAATVNTVADTAAAGSFLAAGRGRLVLEEVKLFREAAIEVADEVDEEDHKTMGMPFGRNGGTLCQLSPSHPHPPRFWSRLRFL